LTSEAGLKGYYPKWVDNLAPGATLEGSMLDGAVVGADNVRAVVTTIPTLYVRQVHKFAGPAGNGGFLEDYIAEVTGGDPVGCVVLVSYNDAGQADHVVASYRPRTSVVHFAQLLSEKFADTPIAKHFPAAGAAF
jgi:hypothetical protein